MLRVLTAIPLLSLLYACGPENTKAGTLSAITIDKPEPDSATGEQAKIAFGSLRFGMTEDEVYRLPEKDRDLIRTVGNERYSFTYLYDKKNKLFMVNLQGMPLDAYQWDKGVRDQALNLWQVISSKYGDPKELLSEYPAFAYMNPDEPKWLYQWEVGSKVIRVGVGRFLDNAEFVAICDIYHKEMLEAEKKAVKQRWEKKAKESSSEF
jgi:hypothetical protein